MSFSSATQGWFLTKNRWYEGAALLLATWMLFLPNAAMNQVLPEFGSTSMESFIAGDIALEEGQKVRLHVTRHTNYGDRYKLYVFTPEGKAMGAEQLGLELVQDGEAWVVSNMAFMGAAEKVGIDYYDEITAIDTQQLDRPATEWVYLGGFMIIALVMLSQWSRRRSEPPIAAISA